MSTETYFSEVFIDCNEIVIIIYVHIKEGNGIPLWYTCSYIILFVVKAFGNCKLYHVVNK